MTHRPVPHPYESVHDAVADICRRCDSEIKRQRGNEIIVSPCPLGGCEGDKFAINAETGAWNCPKCGERGNAWQLIDILGLSPVTIPFARREPIRLPIEPRKTQAEIDAEYDRVRLEITPAVAGWLTRRMIRPGFALAHGVVSQGFRVGFAYFRQSGKLAFIKWRNVTDKGMGRWPSRSTMPLPETTPLFGPALDTSQPVVLTEGEMDTLALLQSGCRNVASVANGAQGWDEEWSLLLATCPRVICAFDDDEHGNAAARKVVERFGAGRTGRIVFQGFKDANDALMGGMSDEEIRAIVDEAVRRPPEILEHARAAAERIVETIESGNRPDRIDTGWDNFDHTQRGLRVGELSVITAHSGAGKTAWTMSLVLTLAERGVSCGYYTFEQGIDATAEQLLMMVSGRAVEDSTQDDLRSALALIPEPLWLAREPEKDRLATVRAALEYGKLIYGTRVVVIDHLDYLVEQTPTMPRHESATQAVKMLDRAARDLDIHVILVSQPTTDSGRSRTGKPPPITLAHTADSRAIRQLANNGWVFSSDHTSKQGVLYVEKARYGPAVSDVSLLFRFNGFRYVAEGYEPGRREPESPEYKYRSEF